ncbi:MAG: hypothetical protein ACK5NT_08950 [Pyrinomonadaceae bacterium]
MRAGAEVSIGIYFSNAQIVNANECSLRYLSEFLDCKVVSKNGVYRQFLGGGTSFVHFSYSKKSKEATEVFDGIFDGAYLGDF